eukprot:1288433-Pyramimonas_sp.AAC.1
MLRGLGEYEDIEKRDAEILTQFYMEKIAGAQCKAGDLLGKVLYCKCKMAKQKQGKSEMAKISLAMHQSYDELQSVCVRILLAHQAIQKHGPPPRGSLERAAQSLLEELEA